MPEARKNKLLRGVFGWVLFIAVALLFYFFHFQTYHFAVVQDGVLYRMGVRDSRELKNAIARVHPRAVVCLVSDQEVNDPAKPQFRDEFKILKKDGIILHRIPMAEDQQPTQGQINEFLQIVNDKSNQPVIVHCAQGVIRTGMMVAAYQKAVLNYNKEQALSAVNIFGKGIDRGGHVRAFIDGYYSANSRTHLPSRAFAPAASRTSSQAGQFP